MSTRLPAAQPTSEDDVAVLLERYRRSGNRRLRNEVVERYQRLSQLVADDYVNRGIEREDLRQIALLGLVKAVERFDPSFGTPFATFASITMNGEIKRQFRDAAWDVRPPRSLQELSRRVRRTSDELCQRIGRVPTASEVAEALRLPRERVIEALSASAAYRADHFDTATTSDDRETGTSGPRALGTIDPGFVQAERRDVVEGLVGTLSGRDAEIIRLRFWDELTQSEIAERMGVSQMHVSRLLQRSLRRLRERHERDVA